MKNFLLIILVFISFNSMAAYDTIPTGVPMQSRVYQFKTIRADSGLYIPPLANTDTSKVLATNSDGKLIQVSKSGGGGGIDSAFALTSANIATARRKNNFVYGLIDQFTGEKVDLVKISSTPTVDNIIYFQSGSEYFQRVVKNGSYNFGWWNPVADGSTNNFTVLRAALTAVETLGGSELFIPDGTFISATSPYVAGGDSSRSAVRLFNRHNITIRGIPGKSILKLAAGTYSSDMYFISTNANTHNILIKDLIVDGNDANVVDNTGQHIHGCQVSSSEDITFDNVTFQNWDGDGLFVIGAGTGSMVERLNVINCTFYASGRNGMTLQRNVNQVLIHNCRFSGGNDQQLDFEPTGSGWLRDIKITDNYFMNDSANNSFAVTLVGIQGNKTRLERCIFSDNHVFGAVNILRVRDMVFDNNTIVDSSGNNTLDISRNVVGLSITNNHIVTKRAGMRTISLEGVDGIYPTKVIVANNHLRGGSGIYMESVGDDIQIKDNQISNYDTTTTNRTSSIRLTNVDPVDTIRNMQITGNILNHKDSIGIYVTNTDGVYENMQITGNTINNPGTWSNTIGIYVSSASPGVITQPLLINNNTISTAFTTRVKLANAGARFYYKSGNDQVAFSEIISNILPESAITAGLNSTCYYATTGTVYVKTTASGNTGWVTYGSQFYAIPSDAGHANDFLRASGSGTQSWATAPTGIGYTLELAGSETSPSDGQSVYSGINPAGSSTTQDRNAVYIPKTGYITRAIVHFNNAGTLGTNEAGSCAVILNGSTVVSISSAVDNSAVIQDFAAVSMSQAVTGADANGTLHDRIEFRFSHPSWATNPTTVRYTVTLYIEATP